MDKDLILGLKQPQSDHSLIVKGIGENSSEVTRIIEKAAKALDYFLVIIPKSDYKKKNIVKELIRLLYKNEQNKILILTSTLQDLDEICEIINNSIINFDDINDGRINHGISMRNFLRIGSDDSTIQKFKHNLINNIFQYIKSEDEKTNLLSRHRVFVATMNSIIKEQNYLETIKCNIVIIDEAYKITSPQAIDLLLKFEKFIMLGQLISPHIAMHKFRHFTMILFRWLRALISKRTYILRDNYKEMDFLAGKISLYEYLLNHCFINGWTMAYDTIND